MAFETEQGNFALPTNVISDGIAAALVSAVVALPWVRKEDLPANTNVKLARKAGKVESATLSESSNWTYDANSEYTEASVTCTATKQAAAIKMTVEAEQFGTLSIGGAAPELGAALARQLDDNILTLFSSFTSNTAVTEAAGMTGTGVLRAAMRVDAALAGTPGRPKILICSHRQAFDLKAEMITSGAANFAQPSQISLLAGMNDGNGYAGMLPGVMVFVTDGLPTSGGDDVALVFNPDRAFFGMYSGAPIVRQNWIGSQGFFTEITAHIFSGVVEYHDQAGCRVLSDS